MDIPQTDARLFAPATQRNREAILDVLQRCLLPQADVLEVASGTGEHAVYFAGKCPAWRWQPSDVDVAFLESIRAWKLSAACENVQDPLLLNVTEHPWPAKASDAVIAVNLLHIAPEEITTHLMRGASYTLRPGGKLIVYGPFFMPDVPTAASNLAFDASLRRQDPRWGLRALDTMDAAARQAGLLLERTIAMPANNFCCIWGIGGPTPI